jgi:hypothetical protein
LIRRESSIILKSEVYLQRERLRGIFEKLIGGYAGEPLVVRNVGAVVLDMDKAGFHPLAPNEAVHARVFGIEGAARLLDLRTGAFLQFRRDRLGLSAGGGPLLLGNGRNLLQGLDHLAMQLRLLIGIPRISELELALCRDE